MARDHTTKHFANSRMPEFAVAPVETFLIAARKSLQRC